MSRSCVMMKFLLLIILTQYAVKCDDTSNYYVIEMPEDPPRDFKRPFRVYWNVPTMQCKSKKIPFDVEEFGIIQNKNDSFKGEKITILYDPGLFPALLKNDSSGEIKFRNGGVPQEGDINLHIEKFRAHIDDYIPDKNFNGVGIIDFESWRPIFRQNFGVLVPYKDVSYEIEKKLHWWWPKEWIQAEAKQRYETKARAFMQTTLSIAKQMRPNALWGYYGFPYCFNMDPTKLMENCADNVKKENNDSYWLWAESSALFPSVYSSRSLSTRNLAGLIRGRVKEARRVKSKMSLVLPYFWFRYREGGFLSQVDLSAALKELYNSNASGLIIWGSSNDVNTLDKCTKLLSYVKNILGPAIAKYTKDTNKISNDEIVPTVNVTSTFKPNVSMENDTVVNTRFIPIDPKTPWKPPKNYSQEISQFVEEELIKHGEYNETEVDNQMITSLNDSLLIDIIMNGLIYANMISNTNNSSIAEDLLQNETTFIENTTQFNATAASIPTSTNNYIIVTEQPFLSNIVTKNPLENFNVTSKRILTSESNLLHKNGVQTTAYVKDDQSTVSESEVPTVTLTNSDEFTNYITEKGIPLFSDETLFDPKDVKFDTTEDSQDVTTDSTKVSKDVSMLDITDDNLDSTTDVTIGVKTDDKIDDKTDIAISSKADLNTYGTTDVTIDDTEDVNTIGNVKVSKDGTTDVTKDGITYVNTDGNTGITKFSIDSNVDDTTDINAVKNIYSSKDVSPDINTDDSTDVTEVSTIDINVDGTTDIDPYITKDVTMDGKINNSIDGTYTNINDNIDFTKDSTIDSNINSNTFVTIDDTPIDSIDDKVDLGRDDNADLTKESTTNESVDTTDGITEYLNLVSNYSYNLNKDVIIDNLEGTTEKEEVITSFINIEDSTNSESTETATKNSAEFKESTDVMKKVKKAHMKLSNSLVELNSTQFYTGPDQEVNGTVNRAIVSKSFIYIFYFFWVYKCVCVASGLCV